MCDLNREPSDSCQNALTHYTTLPTLTLKENIKPHMLEIYPSSFTNVRFWKIEFKNVIFHEKTIRKLSYNESGGLEAQQVLRRVHGRALVMVKRYCPPPRPFYIWKVNNSLK